MTSPPPSRRQSLRSRHGGGHSDRSRGVVRLRTLTLNGEPRPCAPALLEIREPRRALLTLTEGKYHQVRRMLAAVGAPVLSLCRVSIGSLHLDSLNLKPGEWAPIRPDAL